MLQLPMKLSSIGCAPRIRKLLQRLGDRRKRLAQEQRQFFIARQVVRLVVDIVAAEELVRALAGEDHLDILARNLGDKI